MQTAPGRSSLPPYSLDRTTLRDVTIVLAIAFLLRLFRLATPLWLDEAFAYLLARAGPQAILANSFRDPHPPLFYLIQSLLALVSGNNALIWRSISVVSGALAVGLTLLTARGLGAGRPAGLAGGLLVATLPTLVFFSQEARPYAFLVLLAACSVAVVCQLALQPARTGLWAAWVGLSLVGVYSGYSYLMICSIQALFLAIADRWGRHWLLCCLALGVGLLPMLVFIVDGMGVAVTSNAANAAYASVGLVLGLLLFDDPIRYGATALQLLMPLCYLGLAAIGGYRLLAEPRRLVGAYLVAQVLLPPLLFFVLLSPITGIRLPLSSAKQFVPLLAPLFVLVLLGLDWLLRWGKSKGRAGIFHAALWLLLGGMLVGNGVGLARYWATPKSPEGLAVRYLLEQRGVGEPVASLHYSTNLALGFYLQENPIYQDPLPDDGSYTLARVVARETLFPTVRNPERLPVAAIMGGERLWLLSHRGASEATRAALLAPCDARLEASFGPFEVWVAERCDP